MGPQALAEPERVVTQLLAHVAQEYGSQLKAHVELKLYLLQWRYSLLLAQQGLLV